MNKIDQPINEWESAVVEYDQKSRGLLRQLRPEVAAINDNETDKAVDELSKLKLSSKIKKLSQFLRRIHRVC